MYDLIIKNARILDGANTPWFRGDVAVKDGIIVEVGAFSGADAKEIVDAEDKYLAPGFIDMHSHSDGWISEYPTNESRILQGVTTELGGLCGCSVAPINPNNREPALALNIESMNGCKITWNTVTEYFETLERIGISTNFAMLVGHGNIRVNVMGMNDRKPTAEEMAQMKAYVTESMEAGAFGVSSGLFYAPGCFSDPEEMAELLQAVKPYGGFYDTHIRQESELLLDSVREAIEVCRLSGVPLQISHLKCHTKRDWCVTAHAATRMIARAREEGLDVAGDSYPYTASGTYLSAYLPDWAKSDDADGKSLKQRLYDSAFRARVVSELAKTRHDQWSRIVLVGMREEKDLWMNGKSVADVAMSLNVVPEELVCDLLIAQRDDEVIDVVDHAMCEADVEHFLSDPNIMFGSDGMALALDYPNHTHPRSYGAFPQVIGHYCRDRKIFSLETAINKMTGMTASRIGLYDRGLIRKGMRADLVLFDFDTINDGATYAEPHRGATGIIRVYVNGVLTALDGKHTGARAGMVIRKSAAN